MKKPLLEYYPISIHENYILEASQLKPGQPLVLRRVLLQRADAKNRNGRIYPKRILEPVINQYNEEFVKTRRALGELDHRSDMTLELKTASHLITEMHWEGDELYGDLEILNDPKFPCGQMVAGFIERKIPIGISSRANGSVEETNEAIIVQDDLQLLCFDIVSFESTIGSTINLNEGFNPNTNKFDKVDALITSIICSNSSL